MATAEAASLPVKLERVPMAVMRLAGRAEKLGLAISLVAGVREKVWFCIKKGYKPWLKPSANDARTNEQGGHTIWYDEQQLLKARVLPA